MLILCELVESHQGCNYILATEVDCITCQAHIFSPQQFNVGTSTILILRMNKPRPRG